MKTASTSTSISRGSDSPSPEGEYNKEGTNHEITQTPHRSTMTLKTLLRTPLTDACLEDGGLRITGWGRVSARLPLQARSYTSVLLISHTFRVHYDIALYRRLSQYA